MAVFALPSFWLRGVLLNTDFHKHINPGVIQKTTYMRNEAKSISNELCNFWLIVYFILEPLSRVNYFTCICLLQADNLFILK